VCKCSFILSPYIWLIFNLHSLPTYPWARWFRVKSKNCLEKNGNFFRLIQFSKNIAFFRFINPVNHLTPLESDLETLLFCADFHCINMWI
jgi:hypothetical protein